MPINPKSLTLNFKQAANHYASFLFTGGFGILFFTMALLKKLEIGNIAPSIAESLLGGAIFGGVGLYFYFLQKNRLKFHSLQIGLTSEQVSNVIAQTAREQGWELTTQTENSWTFEVFPQGFWSSFLSWGEQVTILYETNTVYINSICSLNKQPSITAWGRNKKNVKYLIENLERAKGSDKQLY